MKAGNKRLVICCDGTWNEPSDKVYNDQADEREPTNVLKVVRGIKPVGDDDIPQVVYYHAGVGTLGFLDKFLGGGLGVGISKNIQKAYRFIANNYYPGDELFLFGFSRGAFTVRSLAGFIGTVGLLDTKYLRHVPIAYDYYRLPPEKRRGSIQERRLEDLDRRRDIPIKFIGVWDTVGALGAPTPILGRLTRLKVGFHDTKLGRDVQNAYQALAVDERRRSFQPDLWEDKQADNQTIEQMWFPGVHANVGGGYRDTVLSDIALKWMTDRAAFHGLKFTSRIENLKPCAANAGTLEDSFSWLYQALRFLGVARYTREIGPEQFGNIRRKGSVPGEQVHFSAVDAICKTFCGNSSGSVYRPENLIRACRDHLPIWRPDVGSEGTASSASLQSADGSIRPS